MNFNKGFYDGKMSDYRKRQFDREEKERHDSMLGLAYMDSNKRLLMDEISGLEPCPDSKTFPTSPYQY